jgi:hypothetical protein
VVAELLRHLAGAAIGTELLHGDPDRLRHSVGARRVRALQAGGEQRPAPGIGPGRLRGGAELILPPGWSEHRQQHRHPGAHGRIYPASIVPRLLVTALRLAVVFCAPAD